MRKVAGVSQRFWRPHCQGRESKWGEKSQVHVAPGTRNLVLQVLLEQVGILSGVTFSWNLLLDSSSAQCVSHMGTGTTFSACRRT